MILRFAPMECSSGQEVATAASASSQRSLLSLARMSGTVVDWLGTFGWITPALPIDHVGASRHGGRVFFACEDVADVLNGVGSLVTFFAYQEPNGLGAMDVRPAIVVPTRPGYAQPASLQALPDLDTAANGMAASDYLRRSRRRRFPISHQQALANAHDALYNAIWQATLPIASMDTEWSHSEMTKRIVKTLYKAAQPVELLSQPWDQAAQQIQENAIHNFASSCGEKPWFFEVDLAPAVCALAWETIQASTFRPRPDFEELEKVCTGQYEDLMDVLLMEKAIWAATSAVLGEAVPVNKISKILLSTHQGAFNLVMSYSKPATDSEKVELFMQCWLNHSMERIGWSLNSAAICTQEIVESLFQALVAPFGEKHPFSCVPAALTRRIGRPPSEWPFLREAVKVLFETWARTGCGEASAKRRRCADIAASDNGLAAAAAGHTARRGHRK